MNGTFYHLGMTHAPGCAPIMACGVHLRSSNEGSYDNWDAWKLHEHSFSSLDARSVGYEPRCPRCLESEYYGMCVLGDL
jgi:hypothetical protein